MYIGIHYVVIKQKKNFVPIMCTEDNWVRGYKKKQILLTKSLYLMGIQYTF